MNDIKPLFSDSSVARTLMDSLPCGCLILDEDGRICAANNVLERVLGVTEQAIVGKPTGEAFGCLNALESPVGCGSTEACEGCEVRNLALTALSKNRKQRVKTHIQLLIDGQVRDLTLLLSAAPLNISDQRLGILIFEDISKLKFISPPETQDGLRGIVGRDKKMRALIKTIRQIAPKDAPVLIQGETGTGKELVALTIHKESPHAGKHFVPINCGALPEGLHESELFGHVKGAFTDAIRNKRGRFELADGGTIFLDELGELSPSAQAKFLRVLQDGSLERVGSEGTVRVDVRVISATNKTLEEEVAAGRFRKDLYYRLCVIPITLPPLRERIGDIPLLVEHFLTRYREESLAQEVKLSPEALSALMVYDWPGNVRELQNALQFALAYCFGDTIEPSHLPPILLPSKSKPSKVRNRRSKLGAEDVAKALEKTGGNKQLAARLLGVSRSTLYRFFARQKNRPLGP